MLFAVMLMTAIGTAGMQSIMPAIGRSLGLTDSMVGLAFALSAISSAVSAPFWGRRVGYYRPKTMIVIGMAGFTISMIWCGVALALGLLGLLGGLIAFSGFIVGRAVYGAVGYAAQPAVQAIVATGSTREERTAALTMLASAFGLGTVLGPALSPFFVLPIVGLSGPSFFFALLGVALLLWIIVRFPDRPIIASAPTLLSAAGEELVGSEIETAEAQRRELRDVRLRDPRILAWVICGLASGHAQVMTGQTIGFLVIDRLHLSPLAAQPVIGIVLMFGALATLLAQWGIVPRLRMTPRQMVIWGAILAAGGTAAIGMARDLHMIIVSFALAALGFGLLRPGVAAGSSLAVGDDEQGAVAGRITSVISITYIVGPSLGILFYEGAHGLPYYVSALTLLALTVYAIRSKTIAKAV